MHRRRLPLKWSIEKNKKKIREQSAMASTKKTLRHEEDPRTVRHGINKENPPPGPAAPMVPADVNHDPAAEERSTKSVADSMNATLNSSSQGNKKKKTKKESPATTAKADSVQNSSGNGSKQVTVENPAEISQDPITQES